MRYSEHSSITRNEQHSTVAALRRQFAHTRVNHKVFRYPKRSHVASLEAKSVVSLTPFQKLKAEDVALLALLECQEQNIDRH